MLLIPLDSITPLAGVYSEMEPGTEEGADIVLGIEVGWTIVIF
jgi:hypothetical protein